MNPLNRLNKATPLFLIALLTLCPELSPRAETARPPPDEDDPGFNMAERLTGLSSPSGGGWNVVPSPNTGSPHNYFYCVAVVTSNDVWAVGGYGNLTTHAQQLI